MSSACVIGDACRSAPSARSLSETVDGALRTMREQGRRAVRIVDLDCRSGRRLIRIARRARALGFVAVEARGCARSRALADAAAKACEHRHDDAIGWRFDADDALAALDEESSEGADLILVDRALLAEGRARAGRSDAR